MFFWFSKICYQTHITSVISPRFRFTVLNYELMTIQNLKHCEDNEKKMLRICFSFTSQRWTGKNADFR